MLLLSPVVLGAASVVLTLVYLARCVSSPLWRLPGPRASAFTSLLLKWHEWHAQRTKYIHRLHEEYGPVVRIAPNEVAFTSYDAVKEIYCSGGSGYNKTEFYNLFRVYDTADEEMMHQVAADDSLQNRLIQHYSPALHKALSGVLYAFAKPRETPLADNFVMESSRQPDPAPFTLLSRLHEKSSDLDQTDKAGENLDHMAAGIDTTGDGLCFLMWELSQPRSMQFQEKLQRELRENPGVSFDKLPFLDAVVQEGLRVFPAIPMSLPRYVPQGGRTIDGHFIPEKTIVSCQAYSVHRINTDVFPRPELFDPGRWMGPTGDAERKRLMFAFANGGRGCVGKHLALAEMKILLSDIYSRYTTLPETSMTAESMAMSDQLISSRPLGQRCLLQFVPIAEKRE
ncbi:hypothetical protein COL940_004041 [Colletotrichum noveboracense]|nr:hypothetical protein COL940_004041 [Colletotrichum noveboracense]